MQINKYLFVNFEFSPGLLHPGLQRFHPSGIRRDKAYLHDKESGQAFLKAGATLKTGANEFYF